LQAIPERFSKYKLDPIDEFFAMGRGKQQAAKDGQDAIDVSALVSKSPSLSNLPY